MALTEAPELRFRTKQEYVYRSLRDAILRCELAPGQRIVIDDVARQLSVSAIPIREALQMLQSEGLVTIAPHVGATVAPLAAGEVNEVFAIMEALETVAAREATLKLTDEAADRLTALVHEMDEALASATYDRWAQLNRRLHREIGEIAGMPMLQEMTERVLTRWERLRRHFFQGVLVPRLEQAQREHHELIQALLVRDVPLVESIVSRHNRNALRSYQDYLRQQNAAG
jgi:DNA-binding GntR family transcriptional regulator